jgi:hypothetical protein
VTETKFWNYGRESLMEMQERELQQDVFEFWMKNKRRQLISVVLPVRKNNSRNL